MSRLRDGRGTVSIELVGILPIMFLIAMGVWQLHVAAGAANAAADAARTASRVQGLGGDGCRAGLLALPRSQRDGAVITIDGDACRAPAVLDGERVEIRTAVPTILPGVSTGLFHVSASAELPGGG